MSGIQTEGISGNENATVAEFLGREINLMMNKMFVHMTDRITHHFEGIPVSKEEMDEFTKKELNVEDLRSILCQSNIRKKRETRPKEARQCIGVMRNGRHCVNTNVTKWSGYTLCPNCQNKEKNKKKTKEEQTCGKFTSDVPKVFEDKFTLVSAASVRGKENLFLHNFENNETSEKVQILVCERDETYFALAEISCNTQKKIEEDMKDHLMKEGYEISQVKMSDDEDSEEESCNGPESESLHREETSELFPDTASVPPKTKIKTETKPSLKRKMDTPVKEQEEKKRGDRESPKKRPKKEQPEQKLKEPSKKKTVTNTSPAPVNAPKPVKTEIPQKKLSKPKMLNNVIEDDDSEDSDESEIRKVREKKVPQRTSISTEVVPKIPLVTRKRK